MMVRDYCSSHVYRDSVLERINNDYGYWANGNWYYYIKDYQGNVRAVIGHAGNLLEVNNYYPYGALMGGGTVGNNASVQPYKYGTKELDRQNGLDWYDSQARMYDPLLGRTPTMDALAEKNYSISPYAWCAGNPIRFIDPTGEYTMENINDFKANGVIVIYQSGYETESDKKKLKALEESIHEAREQVMPMVFVDNIQDLADAMKALGAKGVTTSTYMLTSHGNGQMFYIGEDQVSWDTDVSPLKEGFSGKNIVLNSCSIASDSPGFAGMDFVQELSSRLSSTIFASKVDLDAKYKFDFMPIRSADKDMLSNFMVKSVNGSEPIVVKSLIVNKYMGVICYY